MGGDTDSPLVRLLILGLLLAGVFAAGWLVFTDMNGPVAQDLSAVASSAEAPGPGIKSGVPIRAVVMGGWNGSAEFETDPGYAGR
jgi:hypothetical protein